jgi:DNA-binding response OmpR family regulator
MQQSAHPLGAPPCGDGALPSALRPAHLLVVPPTPALRTLLCDLHTAGSPIHATDCGAESALAQCLTGFPDLIVLNLDGSQEVSLAVCTQLRQRSLVPIVAWTTAWQVATIVQVLAQGADDLLDAFAPRAVTAARLHAILRRQRWLAPRPDEGILQVGDLRLDEGYHTVSVRGQRVPVTTMQYRLLAYLMVQANHCVGRTELIRLLWGEPVPDDQRSLDVVIRRLRQLIEPNPSAPQYLLTVPRRGYQVVTPSPLSPVAPTASLGTGVD